jgi:hypothetical protein
VKISKNYIVGEIFKIPYSAGKLPVTQQDISCQDVSLRVTTLDLTGSFPDYFLQCSTAYRCNLFSHSSSVQEGPNQAKPINVKNNLKFSRYDPLERDFRHFYPYLIHLLSREIGGSTPGLSIQFTRC